MTDWSANDSTYFFDRIVETDAGVIRTTWEVKDHWQMEETMTFSEGTDYFWFTNELIYTGDYISSALEYNGDFLVNFEHDTKSD